MRAAEAYGPGFGYGPASGYGPPGFGSGYGPPRPGAGYGAYAQSPWGSEGMWGSPGDQFHAPSGNSQNAAAKALQALGGAGQRAAKAKASNKRIANKQFDQFNPGRIEKAETPSTKLVPAVTTYRSADGVVHMERAESDAKVISGSPKDDTSRRYVGKVKRFDPLNGYGFIQCHEIFKAFGRDVFLNHAVVGGLPTVGSTVSFNISVNEKGQPQAREAILETPNEKPTRDSSPTRGRGNEAAVEQSAHDSILGKVYRGRIKSFNPGHGFGFIHCEDLLRYFGRDVFLHPNQLANGMGIGVEVEFMVTLNKNQQPQARDIKLPEDQNSSSKVTNDATAVQPYTFGGFS